MGPDVDADMGVSPSDLVNLWDLQHMPMNISIETPPEADIFNTDVDINFDSESIYYDYFLASAGADALGEASDAADLIYGFSHIANFVDEYPEGSDCDEGPEIGNFGFVSDGLCFSSVFSLPVDRDSLFFPPEPHIIESDTIWLYCEEEEEGPPNTSIQPSFVPDTVVTVDIDPVGSGEVELRLQDKNIEPYDVDDKYGEYTWRFEENDFETDTEKKEVTLTAIPKQGYRFSHWEVDEPIALSYYGSWWIQLQGQDMTDPTITLEIEQSIMYEERTYALIAHFEPLSEEPQDDPIPSVVEISTSLDANGQCWASQSSCSCNMVIVIEGTDLTDGSYPVTNVTLTVNGENWHDSDSISETHYTRTVERSVNCDAEFNIEVTATNSIGQEVSATGYVSTVRN